MHSVYFGGTNGGGRYSEQTINTVRNPASGRLYKPEHEGIRMTATPLGIEIDSSKAKKCHDGALPVVVPWSNVAYFLPGG